MVGFAMLAGATMTVMACGGTADSSTDGSDHTPTLSQRREQAQAARAQATGTSAPTPAATPVATAVPIRAQTRATTPPPPPPPTPAPPPPPAPTEPPAPPPGTTYGSTLIAGDGQYLGTVTCSEYETDSIFNRYGSYGSKFSTTSIWNKFGTYGGKFGSNSPFNKYSLSPPELTQAYSLQAYLSVSASHYPAVHPADLVNYCFDDGSGSWDYWMGLVIDNS